MLVSALAGKEHVMAAYEEAVKERYRFFSFGDAMIILYRKKNAILWGHRWRFFDSVELKKCMEKNQML